MNNKRRTEISKIKVELMDIKDKLESILIEEEDSYDNIPENLLNTERAEISENAIEILTEVVNELEEVVML